MFKNNIKKRVQIVTRIFQFTNTPTAAARCVENWKIKLVFRCVKRDKQIKHFINHLFRAAITAVNLVDNHNRAQPLRQSFAKNKFCLRHWPFGSVG